METNYDLKFDQHFLMRHQLFGYSTFLTKLLDALCSGESQLEPINLNTLNNSKDYLSENIESFCAIFTLISTTKDDVLLQELIDLFWSIFDGFSFEIKKEVIIKIYKMDKNANKKSIASLIDPKFTSDLTMNINKLSAENVNSETV
jgi:uncharacterized protein YjgD (DUF1641 family)